MPPPDAVASEPQTRQMSFHGDAGTLFGTYIINLLFTLLTLGVYYFWGKVRVRKYLYSQSEFEGDRFAYHGTGTEVFLGWLKAALWLGLLIGLLSVAETKFPRDVAYLVGRLISGFVTLILIPAAIVGSYRYRMSRTSWREIRFSFRGHASELIGIFFRDGFLTSITLGIYYPYFRNHLRGFLVRNCYFGSRSFEYDGKGAGLLRIYFRGLLLSIVTLGLYYFWFDASRQRYYWSHTSFGGARLRSSVTGGGLLLLKLGNLLLILVTLGLAYPWTVVRTTRYVYSNLWLDGPLDLQTIQQEVQAVTATGEGFTDLLDTGLFDMDLGF